VELLNGGKLNSDKVNSIRKRIYAEKAAAGDPFYQNWMGLLCEKENLEKAMEWYTKAANQGDVEAMRRLARHYNNKDDRQKEFEWLLKAAYKGDSNAQYWVAIAYKNEWGVKQDINECMKWLNYSAQQEYMEAVAKIGDICQCSLYTGHNSDDPYKAYYNPQKAVEEYIKVLTYRKRHIEEDYQELYQKTLFDLGILCCWKHSDTGVFNVRRAAYCFYQRQVLDYSEGTQEMIDSLGYFISAQEAALWRDQANQMFFDANIC